MKYLMGAELDLNIQINMDFVKFYLDIFMKITAYMHLTRSNY